MQSLVRRALRARSLFALLCVPLLLLAACGGNTGTGVGTNPGNSNSGGNGANGSVTLNIGSKLDQESQLVAEMYALTLRDQGFKVNLKLAFGNNTIIFQGIRGGALDLYPEFTATGLDALSKTSSLNDQQDYDTVKTGFKQKFNIDWLDYSSLNDTYAICMRQDESQKLGIHTISDLASKASQVAFYLPSDSTYVFDYLKPKYNLTASSFQSLNKVDIAIAFQEVVNGQNQAKANFCYSTDQRIQADHMVVLQDNNHAFPAYHPAPIVRDSVLQKSPQIATTLNKLAPDITTDVSIQLQNQVAQFEKQGASPAQAIYQTAKQFLTSKGFCQSHGCSFS